MTDQATWTMRIKLARTGTGALAVVVVDATNALELSGSARVGSDVTLDLSGSASGPLELSEV